MHDIRILVILEPIIYIMDVSKLISFIQLLDNNHAFKCN